MSIIAGSLVSKNPEILQGLAVNSASMINMNLNFSKEQELEADYYSLKTLNKLNKPSNSTIELLSIIERNALNKGLNEDMQFRSSHPLFSKRKKIIKLSDNNNFKIDSNLNNNFNFIKAKFAGYSENINVISSLNKPYSLYSEVIMNAKKGDLKNSLKSLNKLIIDHENNIYLLETKADILYSYGYINESVEFYKKVLEKQSKNKYAQIRIFKKINLDLLSKKELEDIFEINLNLLNNNYNNKNILFKYYKLSQKIESKEWVEFLYYWLNKKDNIDIIKDKLLFHKKTKNKELQNFVNLIYNEIK